MENTDRIYYRFYMIFLAVLLIIPCNAVEKISIIEGKVDTLSFNYIHLNSDDLSLRKEMNDVFQSKLFQEKNRKGSLNIYSLPYSVSGNYPNYTNLGVNTGVLFGAGFVALGVLNLLPDGATAWNKGEILKTAFFKRWGNNVVAGPVWDDDNAIFNYVLHPYGGAAYYMSARSQGFNLWYSALYALGISTVFWEYGIEAFMEIPSIQDLIITPIAGTLIGECFYMAKRYIVNNDYKLLGSRFLGGLVAFLVDPVNEVIGVFRGNPCRISPSKSTDIAINCIPSVNTIGRNLNLGISLSMTF